MLPVRPLSAVMLALLMVISPASGLLDGSAVPDAPPTSDPGGAPPEVWVEPSLRQDLEEAPDTARIIVLGLDHTPGEAVHRHLDATGLPWYALRHLPVAAVEGSAQDLPVLLETPGLLSLAGNEPVEPLVLPEARSSNLGGTGDALVRADQARALGYDGSGVGVAIVDSGIDGSHPQLGWDRDGGPLVQNIEFVIGEGGGLNAVDQKSPFSIIIENQTNTDEVGGHGSHVAGTAAGVFTPDGLFSGRAPGADLIGVAISPTIAMLWQLAAFDWIVENKDLYNIRVVSNSWGSEGPYSPYHPTNLATKAMDEAGLLVLFAAGNAGPDTSSLYKYGQAPWVIGVGSTHLDGAVSDFSSRGDPKQGTGPDLVAPGHNIVAPRNLAVNTLDTGGNTRYLDAAFIPLEHLEDYRVLSGTSMATPQVAGIAALLFEARPDLTPAEARAILYETARPIVGHGYEASGHGLVDAEAAVRAALEQPYEIDWVEPSHARWEDTRRVYDYHGAFVGAPGGLRPFYQDMHIPVRLPAEGMNVTIAWKPVAETPTSVLPSFLFRLYTPGGGMVREVSLGSQSGSAGTHTFSVGAQEMEQHMLDDWSAAYWRAEVQLLTGAIEFDVAAEVSYATQELPDVIHDAGAIMPPPPPVELTPHTPIRIGNDDAFTAENGVVSGSGMADDPYVIEGWDIGGNNDYALHIGSTLGTESHVVLRNLRIHSGNGECLILENTRHVRVENVLVENCYWSFRIIGGTNDLVIEDSVIQHGKYGIAIYGAHDVTVRNTTVYNHLQNGIVLSQGAVVGGMRYAFSHDILFEDNLIQDAEVSILTPATFDVTFRDNTFTGSGGLAFGAGTTANTITGTTWSDGSPDYEYKVLNFNVPRWPAATIVDAGSDRVILSSGEVCFDATVQILAPRNLDEVTWDFGDGQGTFGETRPCHIYDPADAPYTATLLVSTSTPTAEVESFSDTVIVG